MINKNEDLIYLCISELKDTWSKKNINFLLGEWCLTYPYDQNTNYKINMAKPFCLDQKSKDFHYKKARLLEEFFFEYLIVSLNDIHNTNYSKRFWKILLGHWVRRYVSIIYNRINSLEENIKENNNYKFISLNSNEYNLHALDSASLVWLANDPIWNNLLYKKIFQLSDYRNILIEDIDYKKLIKSYDPNKSNSSLTKKLKFFFYNLYNYIMSFFYKDNDPVIMSTYMPKKFEFLLQLKLGKIPRFFKNKKYQTSIIANKKLRDKYSLKYKKNFEDALSNSTYNIIWHSLPVCFLEGFTELINRTNNLRWPKSPNFIFTSNEFDSNEYFKCYSALKTEKNSKYFVGQHGAGYGTHRYDTPLIEEETSDNFFSWGWGKKDTKYLNIFSFLILKKPIKQIQSSQKYCLMIFQNLGTRLEIEDVNFEYKIYWAEQLKFTKFLNPVIYDDLMIRLFNLTPWNEKQRLQDFDSKLNVHCKFDKNFIPLERIIEKSKIVIVTFDTTVILELLINDIPFIAFWSNTLEKIRDSAVPFYQVLIDNNLLYASSEEAATKVNEIWDDIDTWWNQQNRINARKIYMKKFCKTSDISVNNLRNYLINKN